MIKIPEIVEEKIKRLIGLEGLNSDNIKEYEKKIIDIRNKLVNLSDNFYYKKKFNEENEIAYLSYNFPMNVAKVIWIMNLIKNLSILNREKLRVLDLGCGEGAGSIGIYSVFGDKIKYFKGIDNSYERLKYYDEFMKITETDFESINMNINDVNNMNLNEFDIIISSNLLYEIGIDKSIRFINKLLRKMNNDTILILVEPALKESSQILMNIRDDIIKKNFVIPCSHKGSCPLILKDGWCYKVLRWVYPLFMEIINRKLFRDLRLKFSYLVIKKEDEDIKNTFCFLSNTKIEKGKYKNNFCSKDGIINCMLLKKELNDKNRIFKDIEHGDIGILENYLVKNKELIRITKDTEVKIISNL